jgi:exosortase K
MNIRKNMLYYLIAIGIFILLKIGFIFANNDDLVFLLKPTNNLIGFVTNSNAQYFTGRGYFHERLNIFIGKSCSGFNFWILCYIMLIFLALRFLNNGVYKVIAVPSILVFAYFLTIFVNASRILFSIFIHSSGATFIDSKINWLHRAEGTFIYLFFLIVIYLGFEYLFKRLTQRNAKFT